MDQGGLSRGKGRSRINKSKRSAKFCHSILAQMCEGLNSRSSMMCPTTKRSEYFKILIFNSAEVSCSRNGDLYQL